MERSVRRMTERKRLIAFKDAMDCASHMRTPIADCIVQSDGAMRRDRTKRERRIGDHCFFKVQTVHKYEPKRPEFLDQSRADDRYWLLIQRKG